MARSEAEVKDLLDQFVCVRVIQGNGMDLSLFQFDYNLTWAVFFLNADRTIYGRYGSRADKNAAGKVSVEGFRLAMEAALKLHQGYPANKASLAGKTGPAPRFKAPEAYPPLQGRPAVLTPATANKACIHCHQLQEMEHQTAIAATKVLPDDLLWAWPLPDWAGLSLDPKTRATVQAVAPGSPGEKDGFKAGDEIETMAGQPVLSMADVQWVLENAKEPSKVKAVVSRAGKKVDLELTLAKGWRRTGDFSWRFFVHEAFYTGNLRCKELTAAEKKALNLAEAALALKVFRVGWPVGPACEAKKAGFQVDDVIIGVDRLNAAMSEAQFVAYAAQKKMPGEKMEITVLRGGKPQKLQLPATRN